MEIKNKKPEYKTYHLCLTKKQHEYIKDKAMVMGLSMKELLFLGVCQVTGKKPTCLRIDSGDK
jgi:hypothetical protein